MSTGQRLPFDQALKLAGQLVEELRPVVKRVKVAGSLRRRRPDVGDIELVVEPELYATDLFGGVGPDLNQIRYIARSWGALRRNGDRQIQVAGVKGLDGFTVELYLVHPPAQWGSILAIRTGPADLGRIAMGRLLGLGYKHQEGFVLRTSDRRLMPTPEEEDFFRFAQLECRPPAQREAYARELLEEIEKAREKRSGSQVHTS